MTDRDALIARLRKFVAEYRRMGRLDPEMVYALHSEHEERFAPLRLSDLDAAADALSTPPPAPTADESAWLIERDIDSVLHYWTGRVIDGREIGAWSVNHLDARRFARREDAACMLTWHCGDVGRVAEHMWTPLRPPVPDTPQGWQPIETAPKDGRAVLLYPSQCWTEDEDRGEVAYWDRDYIDGKPVSAGSWLRVGPTADDWTGYTHWMPLPAAPPQEDQ